MRRREPIKTNLPPKIVPRQLACETALGSTPSGAHSAHLPTHTVFPCVRSSPGRHAFLLSVSHLAARTPSTRHRITRMARVREPTRHVHHGFVFHRPRTDRVYKKYHVYRSSLWVFVTQTHLTHTCIRFPFLLYETIAPHTCVRSRLCVFSNSLFRDNGASELLIVRPLSSELFHFISSILQRYDKSRSEPQEPRYRRQEPGPA